MDTLVGSTLRGVKSAARQSGTDVTYGAGRRGRDANEPTDGGAQMAKFNPALRKVVSDRVYLEVPPG
jgi:hypothetical protein